MSSGPEDQLSPKPSYPPTTTVPDIHASQPPPSSSFDDVNKWGTHVMGHPAAPNVHPDNQRAALLKAADHQQIPWQPYVQYTPIEKPPANNPLESVISMFNTWGNKTETIAKNIWHNLKTGHSVSEAAWGKVNLTAKAFSEGGFESLFKQIFVTDPNEKLKKTFACYLSTYTGPVAGTLYLSTARIGFCSDRPLTFTAPSGQSAWSYYKVKQAQSFYYAAKKKPFTHFECYEVVKNHPSFVAVLPTTPSPYASMHLGTPSTTESSPTFNLGDEDVNETLPSDAGASSSPARPMGTKAAKEARRQKKQGKSPMEQRVDVLQTIASDQASWHTARNLHNESQLNYYKEYIEIQKRKEARADEELRIKKQEEETRIMTMDLEAMTPISKRYFTKRKLAILNEEEPSEDQATDGTYSDCYHPSRVLFP